MYEPSQPTLLHGILSRRLKIGGPGQNSRRIWDEFGFSKQRHADDRMELELSWPTCRTLKCISLGGLYRRETPTLLLHNVYRHLMLVHKLAQKQNPPFEPTPCCIKSECRGSGSSCKSYTASSSSSSYLNVLSSVLAVLFTERLAVLETISM